MLFFHNSMKFNDNRLAKILCHVSVIEIVVSICSSVWIVVMLVNLMLFCTLFANATSVYY